MNVALRAVLRWMWALLLLMTGMLALARRRLCKRRAIVVLAFHRVLDDPDFGRTDSVAGMVMRRRAFERLCSHLNRNCQIVSVERATPQENSRRIRVAVTFDDGWIDNHTVVFPIAREYGISFAAFICPALLERNRPFWPERVAASIKTAMPGLQETEIEKALNHFKHGSTEPQTDRMADVGDQDEGGPDRTMCWAQIEELRAAGITIGAHTQTHQLLTNIAGEAGRREAAGAKAALERHLGKPCDQFAYPNGNHSYTTRQVLSEIGFAQAFTMERGAWTPNSDPLEIPRVNLAEDDVTCPTGGFSSALFEYTAFWKVWRAQRAREDRI
jgi:peptidoglycan/xylan/chitin deacetylase (PgdA/CDA1 family)